jgi:RND family efflux transporter MFP subunit
MNRNYLHTVIILLGLALMAGCSIDSAEDNPLSDEEKESVEVRPEVLFAVADDQPLYQYVESQGVVEANRQVMLKPKISGFVEQSNIVEGRWVEKGDTLLAFESQEWQYDMEEAKNQYDKARSAYGIENRQRQTLGDNQGTNGDSTQSDRMVRIATGLAEAEVALDRAKLNLSYAKLTAPFSGTLAADRRIPEGEYVSAGTELGQLVNDASVRVRFDVLEAELSKVDEGMAVELTAPGGETLDGTVAAVSPVVDTESKTGEVTARVDNRERLLRPGMTVEGRMLVQEESGKARIPRSAILSRDGGRTLVFKLHSENNELEWVYITPKAQNSDWAIVDNENIAPGDTLAVDNHFALSHLQIVTPKMQSLQREGEDQENMELEKQ